MVYCRQGSSCKDQMVIADSTECAARIIRRRYQNIRIGVIADITRPEIPIIFNSDVKHCPECGAELMGMNNDR